MFAPKPVEKPPIWYVYPIGKRVSFRYVAEDYVNMLRKYFHVQVVFERTFLNIIPYSNPLVIIHPYFYPIDFLEHRIESTIPDAVKKRLQYFKNRVGWMVGVDVADSDRMGSKAVEYANICDAFIVNSEWSRRAYVRSGVRVPVYVVPHVLKPEFYREPRTPTHDLLNYLYRLKKAKKVKYLLFFLWHSGWRKGSDLVYKAVKRVQKKRKDVILLVKIADIIDESLGNLLKLGTILVRGWFDTDTLVDLYDLADVVLLFSRGGSFELNGLEAIARGKPIVAPKGGAWEEYIPDKCKPLFLAKARKWVSPLPGNTIHSGLGPEIDPVDASKKILELLDSLEDIKPTLEKASKYVREKYSYQSVESKLISAIHKIIEG
ncbi:MAG: hypothetical protein DRO23_08030 [Thermoprotei archaeon]|nr:MAG: hypothetical protein DRO23_08030 [Thermoprotei archaeon]